MPRALGPGSGPPDVPFREIFGSKGWREKITSNGVFWVLQEEKNTFMEASGKFFWCSFRPTVAVPSPDEKNIEIEKPSLVFI